MGQRILLFEGDTAFAHELRGSFERLGATVQVVDDGTRGLEIAEASRPDLILLTIELPGMNGFLVCKKIKKSDVLKDVPLVILSSEATEETFEQHKKLRTRADEYIRKPIAFSDLMARVGRFVDLGRNGAGAAGDDEDVIVVEESVPPAATSEAHEFADRAIDSMIDDSTDDMPTIEETEEPTLSAPTPSAPPPRMSVPPQDRVPGLERELEEARDRAAELERAVALAERRATAAERAVADASKGGAGGVSGREFLELREQFNRKDRELLELRDQVTQRDRKLIEGSDQTLKLERDLAEATEKLTDLEREMEKTRGVVNALQADKDGTKKRLDDLRARLERSETKSRELEAEGVLLGQERAAAIADMETKHAATLAAAASQHVNALSERERALADEHAQVVARVRAEAADDKRAALDDLAADNDRKSAEAGAQHKAEMAQATQAHQAEVDTTRERLEARHQEDLVRLNRQLADLQTKIELAQEQLEETESARSEADASLARLRVERELVEGTLGRARTKLASDEELLDRVRKALAIGLGLLEDQKSNRFEG